MAKDDEKLNPSRNSAESDYNQKFNKTSKQLNEQENSPENNDDTKKEPIKDLEKKGSITGTRKRQPASNAHKSFAARVTGSMRHKSAFAFIAVVFLGGLWYSSILAPNIILVNMKDLFTNDLADSTTALSKYSLKMIGYKLGKADCSDKESIKCKLTTMSRAQVLAFKKHGFEVQGQKLEEDNLDDRNQNNDKPESRWKVQAIVFPDNIGVATDEKSYAKLASTNDDIRYKANGVWNPRSSFYLDARFKQRIKDKYDLTKLATVYGTNEKEVNESFDESMKGEDEAVDPTGGGAYGLTTLASNQAKSALSQGAMKIAAEPSSYINTQCGFFTQSKVVSSAVQKAKQVTVARFAMQYLKAADQIKTTGQSNEITTNVMSGKLAWSSEGGYAGANATDATMYRHIVLREPVKMSTNSFKYYLNNPDAIGMLFWGAGIQVMLTAKATQGISGAPGALTMLPQTDIGDGPRKYCLEGQTTSSKSNLKPSSCPALTIAAAPPPMVPAVSPIAAASSRICPMPPQGIWQMNPTASATSIAVMPYVASIFTAAAGTYATQAARDFTSKTKGIAASDALFAGTGEILGDMAMSRGLQPANTAGLKQYIGQRSEFDQEYEALARYEARKNPFDMYNSHSFLGSLTHSLSTIPPQSSLVGSLANTLAIIPTATTKTLSSTADAIYNLQPDTLETSRLQCTDIEYTYIGINADMACNVRYSLGKKELDANIKDVVDYMLKPHANETNKNIQDLQSRLSKTDSERDAANVSRQLSEAREANSKPFIDEKTGVAIPHSEYEKYLTYCVNRQDPWGRTSVAVRREELSEEEKAKRLQNKDNDGIQYGSEGEGDPYETKVVSSYMAVTEGAAADQDWYTGKKCLDQGTMLQNFRAYTLACSVDGSFAGSIDCTESDRAKYWEDTDDYITSNDVNYLSTP